MGSNQYGRGESIRLGGGLDVLTAALNALVAIRAVGWRRICEAGLDRVTPLMAGLAVIGALIWALSWLTRSRVEQT